MSLAQLATLSCVPGATPLRASEESTNESLNCF
uniref:Uncharacterized protein n=1 Tax=Siphoviridae sp. ct2vX3 TaxID=2825318 RepID=A0A8S5PZJ0_9CAUD|nr:MAG TPA: hypothetical protein [Siphoviridae sp. ct2vX3]